MKGVKRKVSYVRKGSKSLKTVIPEGVADVLKLKHGDSVDFEVKAEGDKLIVVMSKAA